MLRCPAESMGRFRVRVKWVLIDGEIDPSPRVHDLSPHPDVTTKTGVVIEATPRTEPDGTFEGELCPHEVTLLKQLTGRGYFNGHRQHEIEEVK